VILAGHRAVRLTILDLGTFDVRGGERIIGIPGYLIETVGPGGSARRNMRPIRMGPRCATGWRDLESWLAMVRTSH
jgi:hypothetical protein